MNMQNLHEDQRAIMERLKKEFVPARNAGSHSVINGPIYNCLIGFCAQDLEFARLMLSSDKTLEECFKEVSRGIKSGCSDFEVYTRAVQFYTPEVNGALRQIGIQIEDIGMSMDEMNKTDKDGARALANKAKAALQAMIENVEW